MKGSFEDCAASDREDGGKGWRLMRSNGEGETRNGRQEEEKRMEGGEKPISLFSAGFFCLGFLGVFSR